MTFHVLFVSQGETFEHLFCCENGLLSEQTLKDYTCSALSVEDNI